MVCTNKRRDVPRTGAWQHDLARASRSSAASWILCLFNANESSFTKAFEQKVSLQAAKSLRRRPGGERKTRAGPALNGAW